MRFLARIAVRALGLPAAGAAPMTPKNRARTAFRAAAPVEDEPEAEATEPAARTTLRRAAEEPEVEPPEADDKPAARVVRSVQRAAESQGADEPDDQPAAREMWRAAAEEPDEGAGDAPVSRASPPRPEDQPDDDQELPQETRGEAAPGRVLALRDSVPSVTSGAGTRGVTATPAFAEPLAVQDASSTPDRGDWQSDDSIEDLGATVEDSWAVDVSPPDDRSSEVPPNPGTSFHAAPASSFFASTGHPRRDSDIVIEQIDVFVQEPAAREPARPRLSDPARTVAARYLGRL